MATTKEQVLQKLQDFYGDTGRSREQTKEDLEDIAGHIEVLIESLDD